MNGLVQGIGPCIFETNWEIAQFRVSPAPDQSPASEVRLRKSGFPRIVGSGSKVPNRNRKGPPNPTVWVWTTRIIYWNHIKRICCCRLSPNSSQKYTVLFLEPIRSLLDPFQGSHTIIGTSDSFRLPLTHSELP